MLKCQKSRFRWGRCSAPISNMQKIWKNSIGKYTFTQNRENPFFLWETRWVGIFFLWPTRMIRWQDYKVHRFQLKINLPRFIIILSYRGSTSRSNFFIFFAYLIWVPGTDLSENGFFGILAILEKITQKYNLPSMIILWVFLLRIIVEKCEILLHLKPFLLK